MNKNKRTSQTFFCFFTADMSRPSRMANVPK